MKQSWEVKKLREIGIIQTGTTPPTKDKLNYGDYINFVKPAHFNLNGTINVDIEGLSEIGLKKGRLVEKDSILMVCIGATIGKTALVDIPVSCNQQINSFTPNKNLCSKFFYYALNSDTFYKKVLDASSQATIPIINKSKWENLEVSFPKSFEEQKQIVEILDKAFETIEQAKVNIEKNIQNSKELFQSRLTEIFSQKNDDWEEKKLEELANDKKAIVSGPFGSNLKVADYRDSGVPIIRLQNVGKGYFIEKDIKYIDKEKAEELKSHSFVVGDIVLAKLGIPIGKTCIIPETFNDGIILADIVRIRPDKKRVNYKFLEYFLNTDLSVSQLTKNISGATRPRVNLSNVRNIVVPIPSFETQNKLVFEIDKLSEQTKQLENQYKQKLNNLEELKKSILQKAFSGELIP